MANIQQSGADARETHLTAEHLRLEEDRRRVANWKRWGTYLSERQWGTVREDYSADGNSWSYFPHDHARSRAYRWGEDGLLGWTDRQCRICFSFAFWNGADPILKERLFGLSGPEGNHGEDVKECYHFLDSTPTHSYARALYRYPQVEFPYASLVERNRTRSRVEDELELTDLGVFDHDRFFDCQVEYAKQSADDTLIRLTVTNRGDRTAPLHILPTIWFRNTWTWGCEDEGCWVRPSARLDRSHQFATLNHVTLSPFRFWIDQADDATEWLFTENETNESLLFGTPNPQPYVKDAFHRYLIDGESAAVNPTHRGTKLAGKFGLHLEPGESKEIRVRLAPDQEVDANPFGDGFDQIFAQRRLEADDYYGHRSRNVESAEHRLIQRQSDAGLLWSKQFYHYAVNTWQDGDPSGPPIPATRNAIRNSNWRHLFNRDVLSMPDVWEYPWYAAWDSAFHMIPFATLDEDFAKDQLVLFLREWYLHPNGQIPAYEWALDDVNPPVHAWACWEVYRRTRKASKATTTSQSTTTGPLASQPTPSSAASGIELDDDRLFLARVFHKLLLNFTWWVNRKDIGGRNLFAGGFLGLDNIGIFDRSKPLPTGGYLEQADGTAWVAFYASSMLTIAMELAKGNPAYGDMASKFFEHFISIAVAMNSIDGTGLWDEEDGFYYDHLRVNDESTPLKIRSLVGLIPLITVTVLCEEDINALPGFKKRMDWYLENHPEFHRWMSYLESDELLSRDQNHRLLAVPSTERLVRILAYMLDENEFLSPFGIRSLSRAHGDQPFVFHLHGEEHRVAYVPGESDTAMFGGNSNWRGPIWFPLNFLIIQALRRYDLFFGDSLKVECPTGSGNLMRLGEVANEIRNRLIRLFEQHDDRRACFGVDPMYGMPDGSRQTISGEELLLFHEYFHGDTGRGCGASHQTGWTGLVSTLIDPPIE